MTDDEAITALLGSSRVQKEWDANALWLYGERYAVELFRNEEGETDGYVYRKEAFTWERPVGPATWHRCDEDCQDRLNSDPRDWREGIRFMLAWIGTPNP